MRDLLKKTLIFIMMLTLTVGTGDLLFVSDVYAEEFDGDISENPFKDLFEDDGKHNDITIDDKGKTTPNAIVTRNKIKRKLRISVKSATKQNKKSKRAKIILKRVTKIKGVRYQIKYATNKRLKKSKLKTYKKTRIILKKLKPKKRYYIKARAYVRDKSSGKIYGKWTKCRQIKVKKKR